MIIEIDFEFMLKHEINLEQYMLCYLLHEDEKGFVDGRRLLSKSGSPISIVYKYTLKFGKFDKELVTDLIDRGYLNKNDSIPSNEVHIKADVLSTTNKFASEVFNHWTNFYQLFDLYPDYFSIHPSKPRARLKVLSNPIEELAQYYEKAVRSNAKHKKILEVVKWAKEANRLNLSLEKFVYSRYWKQIEEEYNQNSDDPITDHDNEILI